MELERLNLNSKSGTEINLEALYQICPACFTEAKDEKTGELRRVVDFNKLKEFLGETAVEDVNEAYEFTWVGKNAAKHEAATPINKTLRPCIEESVDWDTTKNLYIEGDNLEVLKLLQNSYAGKVKMIYIDPPYNTGNDFIYLDDFAQDRAEYDLDAGNVDEDGNRFRKNTDSNGRFHSDWCSMMYTRLLVSRTLLKSEGVIFISIDENEVHNMRKICDEVFGEHNFVSQLGWQKVYSTKNQARYFSNDYEFILCYAKNIDLFKLGELPRTEAMNARYKNPDNDPRGPWKAGDCVGSGVRKNGYYEISGPTGKTFNVPEGKHWVYSPETMQKLIQDNRIWWGKDRDSFPAVKQFLSEVGGRKASSLLLYEDYGHTDMAKKDLIKIFPDFIKVPFDTPKPVKLIKMLARLGTTDDDIVLDFFAGSGTTAQSIFDLNIEDKTNRKFILIQIPELIGDNEAHNKGLLTLSDISKERIRRVSQKIKDDLGLMSNNLDIGFRVFKCDDSNMKDVYFEPKDIIQADLLNFMDNIKEDRSELDLLFDCMLKWGVQLSEPMTKKEIKGCTVYNVNEGNLVACFSEKVSESVISAIAEMEPLRVVFRDSSFDEASEKMNLFEIFKQKCGWSDEEVRKNVKVI